MTSQTSGTGGTAAGQISVFPFDDHEVVRRGVRDLLEAEPGSTDRDGATLEHLPPDECLRLMTQVPLGRIVYTRQALPAVELVNFTLHDGDIVIRTDASGKLAAATRGAVVAFEADSVDPATRAGWSVTVIGQSRAVTDTEDIHRLEQAGLVPWAPGKRDHFIRISPAIVNGRRVGSRPAIKASDPGRSPSPCL